MNVGGGHEFHHLFPADPPEAAFAACVLVLPAFFRIVLQRFPGLERVAGAFLLRAVGVDQRAPDQGVLDPQRAVQVPGEGNPALAAARLVWGE